MESILLYGLSLAGFNTSNTKEPLKINKKQKLDDSYGTNISDKMNKIEKMQANNLKKSIIEKKPDFFKQFDELTFDNMGEPTSISDSHMTNTGVNHSLQRGLDLTNGYSNIYESLNYNVISNENFIHNNMTPNTSKRDYTPNSEHSSRKLEAFTGVSDYWVPKQEKNHLFEPMKDLTYVNGMPVMTDYLDDRYLASNKNNMGNLPFQTNVKIRPGLDGENREGLGTVYRIAPRNVDDLRSENKQKVTYENKPLETIKKGEVRAPDYNLTRFKVPDFVETNFEDLVAGRSQMEGERKSGKFTDINTQRGDSDTNYKGIAYAATMGEAPSKNKTKYEAPKKQTFYNDSTHSVVAINVKPVMQNKGSYSNIETQRASLQATELGALSNINGGSYSIDSNFIPLTTLRQLMIDGNTNIGITGPQQKANYVFSNEMVLPTTIRETTNHNMVLGAKGENNIGSTQFIDSAKTTTKETTLANKIGFTNPIEKIGANQFTDSAKPTIKQTTLANKVGFTNPIEKIGATQITDSAKPTIKQTTLANKGGFANPIDKLGATQITDSAKPTIKQTTITYKGGFANPIDKLGATQITDSAKPTIKQTTINYKGGFANPIDKLGATQITDSAKPTIKQTTVTYKGGFANPIDKIGVSHLTDSAKPTIKQTTVAYKGGFTNPIEKIGATQLTDSAKMTTKETTVAYKGGFTNPIDKIGATQLTDSARITIKQTTLHTTPGTNVVGIVPNSYTKDYDDIAKSTIRQTTENNNYESNISGVETQLGYTRDEKDSTKITIKQTTLYTTPGMNVKGVETQTGYSRDEKNIAKPTIKQTTENNNYQGPIYGIDNYSGYIKDENDIAKTTIRETTHLQNYTGGLQGNENQTSHMATDNMCIDERREITTFNRTSGGGTNLAGPQINKNKIKMNTKKQSVFYVTAPGKSLDQSVMPSHTEPYNNNTFENKKPQLSYGDYRTNNIFINTLKDNPLVNDIYHQKNV